MACNVDGCSSPVGQLLALVLMVFYTFEGVLRGFGSVWMSNDSKLGGGKRYFFFTSHSDDTYLLYILFDGLVDPLNLWYGHPLRTSNSAVCLSDILAAPLAYSNTL